MPSPRQDDTADEWRDDLEPCSGCGRLTARDEMLRLPDGARVCDDCTPTVSEPTEPCIACGGAGENYVRSGESCNRCGGSGAEPR